MTTKILHWLLALMLTVMVIIGWYMVSIQTDPNSAIYFTIHKTMGLIIAGLVVFRLLWRFTHKPPSLPKSVPWWQAKLARSVHVLLYICMVVMPLSGFLGSSFGQYGVVFFNYQLPRIFLQNPILSENFFNIHIITAWILVALVGIHFLAALKHALINKDGVFQRMWF